MKTKTFETLPELVDAICAGEIPREVMSPGGAASKLGVTRQAIHDRMKRGTLRAWTAPGVILIDVSDVRSVWRANREAARICARRGWNHEGVRT